MPRFDQSFNGLCEQNLQDTLQLKQRYLDTKNKRAPKSKEKKQQDSIQSSVHVQQKFLKRPADDTPDGTGVGGGTTTTSSSTSGGGEPPVKLQCTPDGLTKFSVEIVQQLEFTTSAANSQPQQISTNVTVKTHANASVKSDVVSSPKSPQSSTTTTTTTTTNNNNVKHQSAPDHLVDCVKQEPDNDFADLEQCAAALEKDANGGADFGGFSDLIGEDTNDEIITSDAFKDLISDIGNYRDFMKDFDFEDNKCDSVGGGLVNGLKVEDLKDFGHVVDGGTKGNVTHTSPLLQNQNNYSPSNVFDNTSKPNNRMPPYTPNMDFPKTELSPAAQTLKQMAEQHQHKNQMGLSFTPSNRTPNAARSPYPDFQYQTDYGSPNSNAAYHKNSPNFPQADMIKQEMIYQGNEFDMKRKSAAGMYKQQQYSPYGSPNPNGHGSPSGYLPRGGSANSQNSTNGGGFNAATPPRPPSGSGGGGGGGSGGGGGGGSGTTLQINQAQQLHISQQNHGHAIQVSAGQHLHLTGDIKGNVSIAAQQGVHFTQQQQSQHQHANMSSASQNQNNPPQNPMNQQQTNPQTQQQQMPNPSSMLNPQSMSQGPMGGGGGGSGGGGMGGGMQGSGQMGDSYSISQSQTINFTQQTLRQRAGGGMPNPMGSATQMGPGPGSGGPPMPQMGPRHMAAASPMDQQQQHQKLLQQQQLLRVQQQQQQAAAMQQQQMIRPPPPEYKANAGMMQSMQQRFGGGAPPPPPNMRRMPHQPMPPSGPMIRPHNMYLMQQQQQQQQQQHMNMRNVYSRQQPALGGIDSMPQHGSPEWRHLLMQQQQQQHQQQQQNAGFNSQLRPNFQHQGFSMNSGGMQLTALQQQQLRLQQQQQQSLMGAAQQGAMGQMGQGGGPLNQMSNMNQQMMTHIQQQQQQSLMQQNSAQITSMHLQQSQSLTVSQTIQQQQQSSVVGGQQLVNTPSPTTQQQQQHTAMATAFNQQSTDFSLEFLENLPSTDPGPYTDQELLNSFDTDSGFNLDF